MKETIQSIEKDIYSNMSPSLKKAFKTFVTENKIPESTEYGSRFLSSKLSFTEGWNAAYNNRIEEIKEN